PQERSKALLYRCAAHCNEASATSKTGHSLAQQQMRCSEPISWARQELNLRPLPCQQNTGNRCAGGRFRRSCATVGVEVKGSNSLKLNALPTLREPADTALTIATSCITPDP